MAEYVHNPLASLSSNALKPPCLDLKAAPTPPGFVSSFDPLSTDPIGAGHVPSDLPPDAPLAMPLQQMHRPRRVSGFWPDFAGSMKADPQMTARRALLLLLTALPTLYGIDAVSTQMAANGITDWLEIVQITLFLPLFAWLCFGFAGSLIGFLLVLSGDPVVTVREMKLPRRLSGDVAVLVPVYHEDIDAVLGRMLAMAQSLAPLAVRDRFSFFILSDSDAETGVIERQAWSAARQDCPLPLYYRRRPANIGRKPGNIADWVRRFGDAYQYMVVLDADSLMSGQTLARLAGAMERDGRLGLIQTIPQITGARTLFARWQQFAGSAYGAMASAGLIWWAGREGNFWGHNAIVRVSAFAASCGLPEMPGRKPFGGTVMSHDMVEGALLRRRGWKVRMVPMPESLEEFPPSLPDLAARDRRWCQGNIQHLPIIARCPMHAVSRFHLLLGVSGYLTAPLWLALIIVIMAGWLFMGGDPDKDNLITSDPSLMIMTIIMLFGPKLMAIGLITANPAERRAYGGVSGIAVSTAVEMLLSILVSPITMLNQSIAFIRILAGQTGGWNPQVRDRDGLAMRDALRLYRPHMVVGAVLLALSFAATGIIAWMSPIVLGLLFAPWIASLTARQDLGEAAARIGLFKTPSGWGVDTVDDREELISGVPAGPLAQQG